MDAVALAGNVIGIARDLQSPKKPEALGYLDQASRRSADIAKALSQPDLGKYSGLVDAEQNAINRGAARDIYDLANADRESRVRSASGVGMFNSDRRDETITREFIRQREASRDAARTNARTYLTAALNANNIAIGGYGQVADIQTGLNDQSYDRQSLGLEQLTLLADNADLDTAGIGKLLASIGGNSSGGMKLLNGAPPSTGSYATSGGALRPTFDVRY